MAKINTMLNLKTKFERRENEECDKWNALVQCFPKNRLYFVQKFIFQEALPIIVKRYLPNKELAHILIHVCKIFNCGGVSQMPLSMSLVIVEKELFIFQNESFGIITITVSKMVLIQVFFVAVDSRLIHLNRLDIYRLL